MAALEAEKRALREELSRLRGEMDVVLASNAALKTAVEEAGVPTRMVDAGMERDIGAARGDKLAASPGSAGRRLVVVSPSLRDTDTLGGMTIARVGSSSLSSASPGNPRVSAAASGRASGSGGLYLEASRLAF